VRGRVLRSYHLALIIIYMHGQKCVIYGCKSRTSLTFWAMLLKQTIICNNPLKTNVGN